MEALPDEEGKKRWLARDAINMVMWGGKYDPKGCVIYYIHRGAPGDYLTMRIDEITEMGQMFFHSGDLTVPYHRILAIVCNGSLIWRKIGVDLSFLKRYK